MISKNRGHKAPVLALPTAPCCVDPMTRSKKRWRCMRQLLKQRTIPLLHHSKTHNSNYITTCLLWYPVVTRSMMIWLSVMMLPLGRTLQARLTNHLLGALAGPQSLFASGLASLSSSRKSALAYMGLRKWSSHRNTPPTYMAV